MCGIYFSISATGNSEPEHETRDLLQARGPDSARQHDLVIKLPTTRNDEHQAGTSYHLTFYATVLALRGHDVISQPLVDETTGSVFCWNGEAWKIEHENVQGNDTTQIFQQLLTAAKSSGDGPDLIQDVLTTVAGPFAFVFYDASSQTIYYGRDRLGRRSLMISQDRRRTVTLSSIVATSSEEHSKEIGTGVTYRIRLNEGGIQIYDIPWKAPFPSINNQLPLMLAKPSIPTQAAVEKLLHQLRQSLQLRVTDIPDLNVHPHSSQSPAKVAILFSGGLDCTILARLTHDLLLSNEPVDLLNVAFENPHTASTYESCPDRVTGRASFSELLTICPSRPWRLVAINVPLTDSITHRATILRLMKPHNTEMDLSISMALYFAARGQGILHTSSDLFTSPTAYTTTARVLLSGLGADELFAGYTRHATAFRRGGFASLISELDLDWLRIGQRNLGRDDRAISHWGREVRYPYLDESFAEFVLGLPVWEKCGFRDAREIPKYFGGVERKVVEKEEEELDPAKMLLRLATWRVGMKGVAGERKRAIQFGARTAKLEGKKKGTDVVT